MPETLLDQEIIDAVDRLSPVSSIIRKLLAVLADPYSDIDDISKLIRVDTALSAQVLRLANSAYFAPQGGVASIEEAIQQTGVNEIMRLAMAINAKQLSARPLNHYRISSNLLWHHALGVAVAAELLAERFLLDVSAAYLSGLLHTMGIVVLDTAAASRGIPPLPVGTPLLAWEGRNFGSENTAISSRVLNAWNFPENITNAVATRYTAPTPDSIGQLGGVLYLACALAERIPAGLPPETGLFKISAPLLESLRLSREDWSDLELASGQKFSRLKALF